MVAIDTRLSVNLNKVALLRNQRDVGYPSVLDAARLVVRAGAHGITVHPRPDERHIRRTDVIALAALIRDEFEPTIEYNIEGYPTPEFIALIGEVRPDQVTLVPDAPDQRTSDHGWDLKEPSRLRPLIRELKASGARISLFMDPDPGIIATAATVGADRIELYTGPYAAAFAAAEAAPLIRRYAQAAEAATEAGLGRQRRARPQPRQPAGVLPGDPAARRGQHRPRDHRRRAAHRLSCRGRGLSARAQARRPSSRAIHAMIPSLATAASMASFRPAD